MSQEQYQAGVCNIGGPEVATRKRLAYLGGALLVIYTVFLIVQESDTSMALFAIIPSMIFSIGFIQSRRKFCLAYGLMGTFNFQQLGRVTKITDKQALAADRRTAASIILQSVGLALILTVIVALISSL